MGNILYRLESFIFILLKEEKIVMMNSKFIKWIRENWPIILLILMILFGIYWAKP